MRLGLALSAFLFSACGAAPAPPPPPARSPVASSSPAPPPAPSCANDDFGLAKSDEAAVAERFAKKRGTMGAASTRMVASSHHLATEAGLSVLRSGGNAADAFVAAALVQDVVLPGVTSTAGLAGILVYSAKTKQVTYLHGGVADPIAPERRWKAGDVAAGKKVLVPGAPAAYAELVKRFGEKPLAFDVEPAARLASDGFPLDGLYARAIAGRRKTLEASAFGKATFFHDGRPFAEGETLRERELGATLRSYGKDPSFFYRGAWAREAVKTANAAGGTLDAQDFATYPLETTAPVHAHFAGDDLYAGGQGGERALVSLEALAQLRGQSPPEAPFESAAAAETMLRILDSVLVMQLEGRDVSQAASDLARVVREGGPRVTAQSMAGGTHSSSVIVVDEHGNVVVGTHTIETLNWGEGLFAGGVPLSTSAPINDQNTTRVRRDPLTATIAVKDGAVIAALAVYGTGLFPADVQLLDAVLARGKNAEDAVLEPRLGYYRFDAEHLSLDMSKNDVDPRFSPALLCALEQRGFHTQRSSPPPMPRGFVDTGFPTLVTIAPGRIQGMTPEPFYIHGVAAGD